MSEYAHRFQYLATSQTTEPSNNRNPVALFCEIRGTSALDCSAATFLKLPAAAACLLLLIASLTP